ncbi:DMT family transporter [Prauserella cavernicola]|uniref:DMT family transporter n=1 Tax=Prauserella cavernicola TaxID=2800127 RepID=A0A934QY26_9PSEU|nr:DMT family transporter [Prauserella cavernicola]MBK1788420.1 DMT family transporter [Prauserella cavernicola]
MVRWLPGFVLVSAVWGASFSLIKIAVDAGVAPLWVALWRCLFGAVTLLVLCAVLRTPLPRNPRTWGHAAVVALLLNAVPFALIAYGETQVSSVFAGVLNATTPLTTLLFAMALVADERPTLARVGGLVTGFVGVLVLLGAWRGGGGDVLSGALACVAATTCYGAGFAYTRRFFSGGAESAAALSATQIGAATAQLMLVTPFVAGAPTWPGAGPALALVLLGAGATGFAYVLNLNVIRTAGPTVASTVTYVTPLWSTAIGVLLLGEDIGWHTLAGAVLVLAGVFLARSRPVRPRRLAHVA